MMDDMEQMIKEKLLEDLIDRMSDQHGSRLKPKELEVEVAAPSKGKLEGGLADAKGALSDAPENSEEDDEKRLMELMGDQDDDEDDQGDKASRR